MHAQNPLEVEKKISDPGYIEIEVFKIVCHISVP
jgi:hypothetical protein